MLRGLERSILCNDEIVVVVGPAPPFKLGKVVVVVVVVVATPPSPVLRGP